MTVETVQMPINICDWHYRSFAKQVLPEAQKAGIGANGMGNFIKAGICTVEEALSYSLNQTIAALVVGIDSMKVLEQDLKIGRNFKPLDDDAFKKLVAKVKHVAGDGLHERFKSTRQFDGPYHRAQHDLS